MPKYRVLFSAVGDKSGNSRLRDEIVDGADFADADRLLELGAIAVEAVEASAPPATDAPPATTEPKGKGK